MNAALRRLYNTGLIGAIALSSAGCSLLFVTPVKSEPARPQHTFSGQSEQLPAPHCTSSQVAPYIDSAITVFQLIRTGVALAAEDSDYEGIPLTQESDVVLGTLLLVTFLGSTAYGFSSTNECRAKNQDYDRRVRSVRTPGAVHPSVVERSRTTHTPTSGAPAGAAGVMPSHSEAPEKSPHESAPSPDPTPW